MTVGEPKPPIKSVIVASGTGSPGIKQVNINLTGPTGAQGELPNWQQVSSQGYPANVPTIQGTNSFVAGLESVVIPNYGGGVNNTFFMNFAASQFSTPASVAANLTVVNSGGTAIDTTGTIHTYAGEHAPLSAQPRYLH